MVIEIDDKIDNLKILTIDGLDVAGIIEDDPERIELIRINQKTKPKVSTSVGQCIYKGEKISIIQFEILFPEQPIVYIRRPTPEWYYLLIKTKQVKLFRPDRKGYRDIAVFKAIPVEGLMGEQFGFGGE